jgi:hypothetical protein
MMFLVLGSSCGERGPPTRTAMLLTGRHKLQIGVDDRLPRDATLGRIVGARLTRDGSHVVVLDFVAPYVKVFDSTGHFVRAFVAEGGGPTEAQLPTAIGTAGDSLVLLGDANRRISVFGLDGVLRAQLPDPGFPVLSAIGFCGGGWLVYGPRFDGGKRRPTWLHHLRISASPDTPVVTDALADSLASPIIPNGIGYGLVDGRGTALLWHTLGAEKTLATWRCGDPEPRISYRDTQGGEAVRATQKGPAVTMRVGPGSRSLAGIAAVDDGVLIGEHVAGRGAEEGHTEFSLVRGGRRVATVRVPGSYVIRDSLAGVGVLFSTSEPVPQLFLVAEREVMSMFGTR